MRLYKPLRGRLRLPTFFAREMELDQLRTVRLDMRGCGDGSTRVDVDTPAPHVMYLRCGWKTFAHAHSFTEGHILHFKLMESGLLSVKIFGSSRVRLGCCVESSTNDESSSSSESDEEDSDGDDDDSCRIRGSADP